MEKYPYIGTSKIELEILDILKTKFDVIWHYKDDDRYPFEADFYIPDLDLFIEYQGFQTHGGHPYDPNNENDKILANKIKEIFGTSKVFTQTDPYKRKIAKENKLNWIEFFNKTDFIKWFNEQKNGKL